MSMNLVQGGAHLGLFQTRHPRLVQLTESFEFSEAPQPGKEPVERTCWKGVIFQADGRTVDTNGVWEQSGAYQNSNGVIQRNDLVTLVRDDTPVIPPISGNPPSQGTQPIIPPIDGTAPVQPGGPIALAANYRTETHFPDGTVFKHAEVAAPAHRKPKWKRKLEQQGKS
jgi:hypothetical protein